MLLLGGRNSNHRRQQNCFLAVYWWSPFSITLGNKRERRMEVTSSANWIITCFFQISYKNVMTPKRAGVAIGCCWLISFLVGMTPLFGWNRLREKNYTFNNSCQFERVITMEYMVYFNFFGWVLPPLVLMLIIYIEVFKIIRKQLNKKFGSNSAYPEKYYGKELQIAKSLALVLFLFALCWLPLHICNCVNLFSVKSEALEKFTSIAICMTHWNSAMNPIVYAFRIKKFRTTFLQIWNQYFYCKVDKNANNIGNTDIAI
ncbi:adenosine receptor A1 isoform X2 [Crotalus tigris]|uniref:adenosine receptor A1 isoform X2 n=1 Tax=Crotalus tigris TaxID=88082 RepID=UPI00192F25ED|nr:adenosine receptor A1 isoform X2 [Crotalus tigris]